MTDYKPGTVAKATVRGVPDVTVFRTDNSWVSASLVGDRRAFWNADVTDVRPLVVLDLHAANPDGNPEILLENTLRALRKYGTFGTRGIANQIEAQTRPAIEEPKGLGAVVEDKDGLRWTRTLIGETTHDYRGAWVPDQSGAPPRKWDRVDAVRVLSPGVES